MPAPTELVPAVVHGSAHPGAGNGSEGAPRTLGDLLAQHEAHRGAASAVLFEGQLLTYGELAARTRRLAARLWHEWGVRPGDRVAWLGLNHPGQLVLLFALARLGALLVPLNFRLAPAEWAAVLADCMPRCLVHDEAWAEAAVALARRQGLVPHGVDELDAAGSHLVPVPAAPADAPVLLVYTSGTTGQPKGAVHTQAHLMANMAAATAVQALTAHDTVATVLPLFHVGGLCIQTLPALYAGARVVLHPRFDAGATLACIERDRPTLTLQVPATMKALVEHPRWAHADLSSLRAVWAGSSLLPPALIEAFHARGLPVCNVYGATETGPFSIALPPGQARSHAGSCGWPAPGVEVRLQGAAGDEGVGELLLRAANVVDHYWPDRPARDAEGWFHTGDLARRAADGSYTIVGRAKDMVISGGENIYPAEIEQLLAALPEVADCAVVGLPDARWGEVVAAALVLRPGAVLSDEALRDYLAARIARYKLPRRVFRLEALPLTALGKVQKQLLVRQLAAS